MPNFTTPLPVDPYARFMADAFDERDVIAVTSAWQAFFGARESAGRTVFSDAANVVDIDIVRGNERTAVLIQRGTDANPTSLQKNTQTQNYSNFARLYPLAEEVGSIDSSQLNNRVAGENPYSGSTQMDRLRALSLDHHMEHIRRIVRLNELLAGQSILFGQQPSIGVDLSINSSLIYDFQRNAANTITVGTGWNQVGATILADIDGACDIIRQNGKIQPDMIVIGGQALDEFINNTDVQTKADNRRFELIEVSTNNPVPPQYARFVEGGFNARGRLRTPKGYVLWIFSYLDGFEDSSGTFNKYMPEDVALIASSRARCDRYFGPSDRLPLSNQEAAYYQEVFGFNPNLPPMPANISNMDHAVNPAMFHFDSYHSNNRKTISVRTQCAPIYATTHTDAFAQLNGLIT